MVPRYWCISPFQAGARVHHIMNRHRLNSNQYYSEIRRYDQLRRKHPCQAVHVSSACRSDQGVTRACCSDKLKQTISHCLACCTEMTYDDAGNVELMTNCSAVRLRNSVTTTPARHRRPRSFTDTQGPTSRSCDARTGRYAMSKTSCWCGFRSHRSGLPMQRDAWRRPAA